MIAASDSDNIIEEYLVHWKHSLTRIVTPAANNPFHIHHFLSFTFSAPAEKQISRIAGNWQ